MVRVMKLTVLASAILLAACVSPGKAQAAPKDGEKKDGGSGAAAPTYPKEYADALSAARQARCQTAICWGKNNMYAIEPLAELPIGKSFTLFDPSGLGQYINNHNVSVQLAAGLRWWFAKDYFSVSLYLSQPVLDGDSKIRLPGSTYEHPASRVKRPYPGIAVGFLGDTIWLGLDIDELHNGDTDSDRDTRYVRDSVISRTMTFTLALTPVTTARNGLGTLSAKNAR